MTEPLDELTVQAIGEYGGKTLTDLGKENVDLGGDETEKIKKEEQSEDTQGTPKDSLKPFRYYWLPSTTSCSLFLYLGNLKRYQSFFTSFLPYSYFLSQ